MASATRQFARVATRATTRSTLAVAPRHAFRQQGRRFYSSEPTQKSSSAWIWLTGLAAVGGAGYWYTTSSGASPSTKIFTPTQKDYQQIYNEIAARLEEKDDYDDGSFGPVLLRLAWHASGTYDKETGTGGSNGATMRFAPEGDHGANAGLLAARDFLEPVKSMCASFLLQWLVLTPDPREPPLDQLLRSLDSRRCCCHPGDAGPYHSLSTWTS